MKVACCCFALFWVISAAASAEDLALHVLDQCDRMQFVGRTIRGQIGSQKCGVPSNTFEKVLLQATQGGCLLPATSIDSGPAFSCVVTKAAQSSGTLSCFRDASLQDVKKYPSLFSTHYAPIVDGYEKRAAKCGVTNGDVEPAPRSLFNGPLTAIARYEFGFVAGLGNSQPADAVAVHGYATTDPSLTSGQVKAIEFVYAYSGAHQHFATQERRRKSPTKWRIVEADDLKEINEGMKGQIEASGLPFSYKILGFELVAGIDHAGELSDDLKKEGVKKLKRVIGESLEDEGFDSLDDDEFKEKFHLAPQQFIARIEGSQPFGARGYGPNTNAHDITAYLKESNSCASAVFLFGSVSGTSSPGSYGDVAVVMIAAGPCSKNDGSKFSALSEQLKKGTKDELED